jgi:hypothetical protein
MMVSSILNSLIHEFNQAPKEITAGSPDCSLFSIADCIVGLKLIQEKFYKKRPNSIRGVYSVRRCICNGDRQPAAQKNETIFILLDFP